ncbi:hypothetical protein KIN20_013535 [Parelaphostrongylus tenuis]|uniref:Uncharacterized protein n=1 Tax=Parelaphostrongylus tenuis TaxID=148309 RepID=A0AAD5MY95_PARTN|nr:hypothetical protein KIN20_013535 [Parelaphostrongylus tenuis]
MTRGGYAVVETVGQMWRDHRRFAIHVLKDLGLSKDITERRDVFDVGVGSVISQLMLDYRYEGENLAEFRELKRMVSDHMNEISKPSNFTVLLPMVKDPPAFEKQMEDDPGWILHWPC